MADLISELKKEHEQINKLLASVYDYISTYEKKIEFVKKLKEILTKHKKNEDKSLYSFLEKEARDDEHLKTKLDEFAKDWDEIFNFTTHYIDKYGSGDFDDKFTTDTAKLLSSLRQRLIKEEVSLFAEYSKRQ